MDWEIKGVYACCAEYQKVQFILNAWEAFIKTSLS